jgi:hypothetical protein
MTQKEIAQEIIGKILPVFGQAEQFEIDSIFITRFDLMDKCTINKAYSLITHKILSNIGFNQGFKKIHGKTVRGYWIKEQKKDQESYLKEINKFCEDINYLTEVKTYEKSKKSSLNFKYVFETKTQAFDFVIENFDSIKNSMNAKSIELCNLHLNKCSISNNEKMYVLSNLGIMNTFSFLEIM